MITLENIPADEIKAMAKTIEELREITEDYVSYEIAKLLKEKGFDEYCRSFYELGEPRVYVGSNGVCNGVCNNTMFQDESNECITRPTHQMAMKWLREVHNLCIAPYAAAYRYGFTIDKCDTGSNICNDDVINEELTTYEEAVDAALKCCLTELI